MLMAFNQPDIVECGVGNGQTLSYILFNLTYNVKHFNRRYIGFDSFEGFPEPGDEDNSRRILTGST